jgi:hypothetical protein
MGTGSREREGVSPYGPWDTPAEPRRAADCLQRPLCSRFRQQLRPSVDMTSDVKSGEQLFYVCLMLFLLGLSEEPEPVRDDG